MGLCFDDGRCFDIIGGKCWALIWHIAKYAQRNIMKSNYLKYVVRSELSATFGSREKRQRRLRATQTLSLFK